MSDQSRVSCAACGTNLPGRVQDDQPCPDCGSNSRSIAVSGSTFVGVTAHANLGALTATAAGTVSHVEAHAGLARGEGRANDTAAANGSVPTTLTGAQVGHSATVVFSRGEADGMFFVEVLSASDSVVACAYGDDAVGALLNLIPALLPPDHPEYETLTETVDDLG